MLVVFVYMFDSVFRVYMSINKLRLSRTRGKE